VSWFRRSEDEDDGLEPPPFDPEPVAVDALRARVIGHIDQLLPYGIDEATPYVLDQWVDRNIDVEIARRLRDWARYKDELMPYLVDARAEAAEEAILSETDQRDLAEYRLARDEAVRELLARGKPLGRLRRMLRRLRRLPRGRSQDPARSLEE